MPVSVPPEPMRHRAPPIARVRLARSLPRLLAMPVLVLAIGFMAVAAWPLGFADREVGGMVLAALGAFLALAAIAAAVILLSLRLEVRESSIRLAWLGGERHYALSRGPVTRVRLRGPDASRLQPRLGMFGWAVGSARLRDEEDIHVVRLARTRTAILVPTDGGRLAIAAADEEELLDALSRAARARQRLESIGPPEGAPEPVDAAPLHMDGADASPSEPPGPTVEVEPRILTGIERALLEQRLAAESAAAATAQPAPAEPEPAEIEPAEPEAGGRAARRPGIRLGRPRPSLIFAFLPLLGAGVAWGIGVASGTYPDVATDAGRLTALALVLAGPATSVGTIMAWTWWPRLVGVVVFGGLAASVFIGRALLG
jgi:hypothetical protein